MRLLCFGPHGRPDINPSVFVFGPGISPRYGDRWFRPFSKARQRLLQPADLRAVAGVDHAANLALLTIARAFEAGAADYIVKPFSATELTARVCHPCPAGMDVVQDRIFISGTGVL